MTTDTKVPTRQEMFDRAVRGLASQGWQQCVLEEDEFGGRNCVYSRDGKHCAWGWVDQAAWSHLDTPLNRLAEAGVGFAGKLSMSDRSWARALQNTHDNNEQPKQMLLAMYNFGQASGLSWPEDVPTELDATAGA